MAVKDWCDTCQRKTCIYCGNCDCDGYPCEHQKRNKMKTPLPERIHQIIAGHKGIKASRLCAHLSTEYIELYPADIKDCIIAMVMSGEIYEIEYLLPDGLNESLLLPNGSEFKGVSK